ncbi:MAG: beta-galactosidase [Candidatus Omnitrophota bacterium]
MKTFFFSLWTAGILCLSFPASGGDFFPVGVWYGGGKARAPMLVRDPASEKESWKSDLLAIRSLGFNSIKCWVDWATAEPEKGRFHFENLEQLLSLTDEIGLRVIIQMYADSAPEWVGEKYPGAAFVNQRGQIVRSQASPGYCVDHPGVRKAMMKFYEETAKRAREHPSFFAWDLWSEPHIVNWVWFDEPAEFCYCPYTQERFRSWLKKKYSTLDGLNHAWYRTFTRWDQAQPPRFGTILSYTDFIDWKSFIPDKLQEDLQAKAEAVRKADSQFIVSSHSAVPSVLTSPLYGDGNPDDWGMSQVVDHYGTSIYPKHASSTAPWSVIRLTAGLDAIRSAGREKGWWIGELQAGQGATGVRVADPVTAADLRLWGWTVIARGARSISYYAWFPMSSGYESNGYGMVELDGTITERAEAAGRFARIIDENRDLFLSMRPLPAQAAVMYNPLAYMAGGNTVGPGQAVRDSLMGFYRAMFERNIPVDFVHADEIVSGMAERYKMIYLPTPLMLQKSVAEALKEYVRRGGTLISEARPAWNDEKGFANERIPGAGLDEVFGCREKVLNSPPKVEMILKSNLPEALAPMAGKTAIGAQYAESLDIASSSTEVWACFANGDAAMTASAYGKGKAVLIGSFLAAAYDRNSDAAAGQLLQSLVSWAGVDPEIEIEGGQGELDARLLESDKGRLFIGVNYSETAQEVKFIMPSSFSEDHAMNLENGEMVSLSDALEGCVLTHAFQPRDVLVLLLPKERIKSQSFR